MLERIALLMGVALLIGIAMGACVYINHELKPQRPMPQVW
jgi:hypothetical protein